MGLFKANPEKEAKKREAKELRKALEAAGRTNYVMIHHISRFPKSEANVVMGIGQGVEKNTLRINGETVTVTGLEWRITNYDKHLESVRKHDSQEKIRKRISSKTEGLMESLRNGQRKTRIG